MSLHQHVAVVAPGLSLDRSEALVAAARSRGLSADVEAELRTARERLADLDESVPSVAEARRRVAETGADLEALRERVATLRGRLQEAEDDSVREAHREAVRELSAAETEHAAAREALEEAREEARRARDVRERRLRLEDRIGNLQRRAREQLREAAEPDVDEVVAETPGSDVEAYETAGAITAALALVRYGSLERPVTLACRRFPTETAAEAWLGTPVVRI